MKVQLFLLAIVLLEPVASLFPFFAPPHPGSKKGGGNSEVKQLEKQTEQLVKNKKEIVSDLTQAAKTQEGLYRTLVEVQGIQEGNVQAVDGVSKFAKLLEKNLKSIEKKQNQILNGQKEIEKKIEDEHKDTRGGIDQTEKRIEDDLEKVLHRQQDILGSLQKSEDSLAAGFHKLDKAEQVEQDLIGDIHKRIKENAEANARGQANITDQINQDLAQIEQFQETILARQQDTLDRISSLQENQEDRLGQLLDTQSEIFEQIDDNTQTVGAEISESVAIDAKTDKVIEDSQKSIQRNLGVVIKSQGQTQHLAKKCVEASKCDVSGVEKDLLDILNTRSKVVSGHQKQLKEVRSEQSQTQSQVESSEKTLSKAVSDSFNRIDGEIKSAEKLLDSVRGRVRSQLKAIEKDIRNIKNSQASALKLIAKIAEFTAKIAKLTKFKSLLHQK